MKRKESKARVYPYPQKPRDSSIIHAQLSNLRDLIDTFRQQAADVTDTLEGVGLFGLPNGFSNGANVVDFYSEVRRFEIFLIRNALRHTRGSQVKAARLLKMNETTLNTKLKNLNIDHRDYAIVIDGHSGGIGG